MSNAREQRRVIIFSINPWRKRKEVKLPPKTIKRSEYAQQFIDIGAGWNE